MGRIAEHIGKSEVNRLFAVFMGEYEAFVVSGFAYNVHGGAFAVSYAADIVDMAFINHHTHSFLTFIAYYLFVGECAVADRQIVDVDTSACRFNQL